MNKKLTFAVLMVGQLLFVSKTVAAASTRDWKCFVSTLSGGAVWAGHAQSQTYNLAPGVLKTYGEGLASNTIPSGDIFVGMQQVLNAELLGQIGLDFAVTGAANYSGQVWDDASQEFNNYSYQYKLQNARFTVKGKLLLDEFSWGLPWVSASVGAGFNRAYDYSNTPLIFEAVPNSNFSNKTTTSLAYTVGAGVQRSLNPFWQVGIGYEFANWGKSSLGAAATQTENQGISLSHLYTNAIMFNITYVA